MQGRVGLGRGFRQVWTAAAISNLGDGLVLAALPLLAESLTKTAVLVSGIVTMRYAAWLVLGLFGGVVADRADRRWVMIVVDVGRAVIVAGLGIVIVVGTAPIALLWLIAFLLGCGEVFFDSASQAMLPSVIGDDDLLERANSRLYVAQSVTTDLIGPPIGAFLFAAVAALPFLIDAGSFAAAALIVATLAGSFRGRPATTKVPAPGSEPVVARPSVRTELREAWHYVRGHRLLRSLIALGCGWNFFAIGAMSTNVLFARRVLHVSDTGYGFGRTGEFRLGYEGGYEKVHPEIGNVPDLPTTSGATGDARIQYKLTTVDDPVIPRAGTSLLMYTKGFNTNPAAPGPFPVSEIQAQQFFRISAPSSIYVSAFGGSSYGYKTGVPYFLWADRNA